MPKKARDRTGETIGYLTVLGLASGQGRTARWLCQCKCGQTKEIHVYCLKPTGSQSCGCLQREKASKAALRGGWFVKRDQDAVDIGAVVDSRLGREEGDLPW